MKPRTLPLTMTPTIKGTEHDTVTGLQPTTITTAMYHTLRHMTGIGHDPETTSVVIHADDGVRMRYGLAYCPTHDMFGCTVMHDNGQRLPESELR